MKHGMKVFRLDFDKFYDFFTKQITDLINTNREEQIKSNKEMSELKSRFITLDY